MIGVKKSSDPLAYKINSDGGRSTPIGVKKQPATGPLDPEPSGRALAMDRATQFGSSLNWAAGGVGSPLTQGASNYKPPEDTSEGGMS